MDYKEKYNTALDRARKLQENSNGMILKKWLWEVFPELQESEDERIRKDIIRVFKGQISFTSEKENEKYIAWLEKQKDISSIERVFRPVAGCDIAYAATQAIEHQQSGYKIVLAFNGAYIPVEEKTADDIVNEYYSWIKKQAESNPYSGVSFEYNGHAWGMCARDNGIEIVMDGIPVRHFSYKDCEHVFEGESALEAIKEEKVDNQNCVKPVDIVIPKFDVGNWYQCTKDFFGKGVTFDKNTAYYCAQEGCLQNEYGCHIAIVKDLYDNFKLWCIEDARDGDVLSINWREGDDSWEKIIIFKKYHNKGVKGLYYLPCIEGYGNTFKNGKLAFQEEVPYYSKTWTCNLHPATKEQRHLLFTNMKEAGWEWDNENKELKKFELKFNVGDWIVTDDSFGKIVRHIDAISFNLIDKGYVVSDENGLIYNNISFDSEHKWHKWSIADAEDGDVLVDSYSKDSIIILYKGIYKERSILAHCGWNGYNFSVKTNGLGYGGLDNTNYLPATKEQRELLFQKMKEAVYEWNSEEKELSKQTSKNMQRNMAREEKELLLQDLEWIDMETNECHCYNCELFDRKNNVCKCIDLCKNPKRTYKGFYIK